jgi:hypothetical protein
MKKLILTVEALEVETFEPEAVNGPSGSVAAYQLSGDPIYCETWNPQDYHCYFSRELGGHCTPVCYTPVYECATDNCS